MQSISVPGDGILLTHVTVIADWIDYNDHMNVAYYVAAFDLGIDAFKAAVGIDGNYISARQRSTVALEAHITYQNEAALGDDLQIETRVIDFDGKRVHYFQEMYRDRALLSTQEVLSISFDLAARRTVPFEEDIAGNFRRMVAAQGKLPRPRWAGRQIGLQQGKPGG